MRSSSSSRFDIREAVESIRDAVMSRTDGRPTRGDGHGDIRMAIFSALTNEPKNGHQIIQSIVASSGGLWMPSAGVVYPALQLLTDEGLISTQRDDERTLYLLTDAGREAAAAMNDAASAAQADGSGADTGRARRTGPGWSGPGAGTSGWRMPDWNLPDWNLPDWGDRTSAVPKAGVKLAQAAAQVAQSGTREQNERAAAILDEARRSLYAILAEG